MASILYSEILKLKRTLIIWLIPIGALIPSFMSFSIYTQQKEMYWIGTGWGPMLHTALVFMNYAGPCMFSIITGFIFAGEYMNSTVSFLFNMPIRRFRLFIGKLTAIFLVITATFLLSAILIMIFGFFLPHGNFSTVPFWSYLKTMFLVIVANFLLVPIAVLVAIVVKNRTIPSLLGIAYALFLLPSVCSRQNYLYPWCIPTMVASQSAKALGGYVDNFRGNLGYGCITLVLTFTLFLLFSLIYFEKSDVI
jgi:bacitracin transport system permease protein